MNSTWNVSVAEAETATCRDPTSLPADMLMPHSTHTTNMMNSQQVHTHTSTYFASILHKHAQICRIP